MRRPNLPISVLTSLIVAISGLVAAAPAVAYNVGAVYRDCENNGQLTGHYSQAQLQAALNQLPAQVSEYSACADVIRQALVRASSHGTGPGSNRKGPLAGGAGGGHHGGGGSGGKGTAGHHSTKADPSGTRNGHSPATSGTGASAVALTGSGGHPSSAGGGSSSLPAPLLVVLILLALTAVSGGAVAIRRRAVARGST